MINKGNTNLEHQIVNYINTDSPLLLSPESFGLKPKEFFSQTLLSKHCHILEYIIIQNSLEILKCLLEESYSIDIMDIKIGKAGNLLHIAFSDGNCKSIQLIIHYWDKIHLSPDDDGNTELHKWLTYHSTCKQCLKALSVKFDLMNDYLTKANKEGSNAFEIAAVNQNEQACAFLLQFFRFDYGHRDNHNETILHKISRSNLISIVDNIPCKNILGIRNNNNETCFTLALEKRNYHLAEFYIDKGGLVMSNRDKEIAEGLNDIPLTLLNKVKASWSENRIGNDNDHSNALNSIMSINSKSGKGRNNMIDSNRQQQTKAKVSFNLDRNKNTNQTTTNPYNATINVNANHNEIPHQATSRRKGIGTKYPSFYNKSTPAYLDSFNITNNTKAPILHFNTNKTNINKLHQGNSINIQEIDFNRNINSNSNSTSLIVPSEKESLLKSQKKRKHEAMDTNQFSTSQNTVSFTLSFNIEDIRCFTIIPPDDLIINRSEVIHYGENCILYKGSYVGIDVSIKVFNIEKMTKDDIKFFNNEILLNLSLRHPHIVTCLGTCQMDKEYCLVMEYLGQNSLKTLLDNKRKDLPITDRIRLIYEIALGIYYFHSRNPVVCHRDLKSSNVLIDNNNRAKLCDFGIAKIVSNITETSTNVTSTPYWMAPEFILENKFNEKSDIYSFGILMWEVLNRDTLPYKNRNEFDFIIGNKEALEERPVISNELELQCINSNGLIELMCLCWDTDPNRRPTIVDVVNQLKLIYNNKEY